MSRGFASRWVFMAALALSGPLSAHPGHEYSVDGTISKVRSPHFEVEDSDGGRTTFLIVPATEVFVGDRRGAPSDIVVGVRAKVDGVENDTGLVEAKMVRLGTRSN